MTRTQYSQGHSSFFLSQFQEKLNHISESPAKNGDPYSEILHFGDDYRQFINSLSDSSVTNKTAVKSKKIKRKTRKREVMTNALQSGI